MADTYYPLHDGNVIRRQIQILRDSDDMVEVEQAYVFADQHVKALETTIIALNTQLREHRAPEPRSRNGREVTRLRHVVGNLMDLQEIPDEARDDVAARLAHPVTSPVEVVDTILTDIVSSDKIESVPAPVSASAHVTYELGYN
jgi:hypothetical protein